MGKERVDESERKIRGGIVFLDEEGFGPYASVIRPISQFTVTAVGKSFENERGGINFR